VGNVTIAAGGVLPNIHITPEENQQTNKVQSGLLTILILGPSFVLNR
jgi:hypothetical protein